MKSSLEKVMAANPLTVHPDTSLRQCARLHIHCAVRHIPVVEHDGGFVGIVTDTDVFQKIARGEVAAGEPRVARDVLTPALLLEPTEPLASVLRRIVASRAEVAVAIEAGRLSGLFTEEDAVRLAAGMLTSRSRAGDIGSRPARTVHMDTPAYAAWLDMLEAKIRHMVVVDDARRPTGVISLRDLAEGQIPSVRGPSAAQMVRRPLETIASTGLARDAARAMARHGIGCLPVVDPAGRVVAVLTRMDILRTLALEVEDAERDGREEGPAFGRRRALPGWKVEDVLRAVREGLAAQGFGVLTELAFDEILRQKVGAQLRPYRVLGACDPGLALRAIRAEPEIGLLLPCHVVVFERDDGTPVVSVVEPRALLGSTAEPELESVVAEVEGRLHAVVDGLAAAPVPA
jgi:CBS domain-containing protein/uncharacterized protein (DUF302 family)